MSLSLVYDKSAFLHDDYTAAIEICCALIADKRTLFLMRVASLLLSASFSMTFVTCIISLLLGALFNTKLLLQNFILEHYSYCIIKCLKRVTVECFKSDSMANKMLAYSYYVG